MKVTKLSNPYREVTNLGEVIVVITSIGFGSGLIIGAIFPKEKIVWKRGRLIIR